MPFSSSGPAISSRVNLQKTKAARETPGGLSFFCHGASPTAALFFFRRFISCEPLAVTHIFCENVRADYRRAATEELPGLLPSHEPNKRRDRNRNPLLGQVPEARPTIATAFKPWSGKNTLIIFRSRQCSEYHFGVDVAQCRAPSSTSPAKTKRLQSLDPPLSSKNKKRRRSTPPLEDL
jgi:hypothetical protein